jgi:hypothetical protein
MLCYNCGEEGHMVSLTSAFVEHVLMNSLGTVSMRR